jgi:hypothetical protein
VILASIVRSRHANAKRIRRLELDEARPLDDAFINSGMWKGPLPPDYEVE